MLPSPHIARLAADDERLELFSLVAPVPQTEGAAPAWITVFPRLGRVETRDGRTFDVNARTLLAAFQADALELPVDVNHATDTAGLAGGRSDAVGWVKELREGAGGLEARVDWLDEGRALLKSRAYRYISPSFYREGERATRLKGVALVTSPALAGMPALASAAPATGLSVLATALGLDARADLPACLAAVAALKAASVPREVHAATVERLGAVTTELAQVRADVRSKRVEVLLEGALKDKRIVPAERDHYARLCATDDGMATVETLFASMTPARALRGSGLDGRRAEREDLTLNPGRLALLAQKVQDEAAADGRPIAYSDAISLVTQKGER